MTSRIAGGAFAAVLVLLCASPASARDGACWSLLYRTIERSAAAPHMPFISYSESENITDDGHRYERSHAAITYRDDGVAYVDDDRWVHPFISEFLDPGPPVLGPYGGKRGVWLAFAAPARILPTIADVRNPERTACIDLGDVTLGGRRFAHIVLPDAPRDAPSLKAIWIDRSTLQVRRLIVSAWLTFDSETGVVHDLTDYSIDLQRVHGIDVLRRVSWTYTYRVYSQYSTLDAQYTFWNYRFNKRPPVGTLFALNER